MIEDKPSIAMPYENDLNPCIIEFPKIGNSGLGYISVCEKTTLPFVVKRIYWTYFTPEDVTRGGHAHYELEQILLAGNSVLKCPAGHITEPYRRIVEFNSVSIVAGEFEYSC